jgi:hypothetical protein
MVCKKREVRYTYDVTFMSTAVRRALRFSRSCLSEIEGTSGA